MKKYKNIIDGVRRYEEKNHIYYAMTNGSLYGGLRMLKTVATLFAVGINILLILSFIMKNETLGKYNITTASFVALIVTTVVVVIGAVLVFTKCKIIGSVVELLPLPFMFYTLITEYQGEIFDNVFLWRHLIPIGLIFLLTVSMLFVAVREYIIFTKNYNVFVAKLYDRYFKECSKDGENVSDEKWHEYLNNYNVADESKNR